MTAISAGQVKQLRDKTGAGMMDCKTALTETQGDMEQAVDWLRKKGLSKAATKAGRVAAEGLIGVTVRGQDGGHRRGELRDRLRRPQRQVPGHGAQGRRRGGKGRRRSGKLLAMPYARLAGSVEDHVKDMVATIGENMSVRRTAAPVGGGGGGGRLRPQQGRRRPRQDRRAGGAREQGRAQGESPRSAANWPCTLPRQARRR